LPVLHRSRANELVNLKKEDVDFEEGVIKIKKGKGGRFRKVPLHPLLENQLKKYIAGAPEMVNSYLFCNRQGFPISTDYVHHFVEECAKKAGLEKKVTPHMLRHSFATHIYRQGVKITVLAKLLGHAGIRSTAIYTHTDLVHLRQAVEKLNIPAKLELEISKIEGERDGAGSAN
jgi:site-specific recombinase XerD